MGIVPAVALAVYRLWARRSAVARPSRTVESVSWGGCEGRYKGEERVERSEERVPRSCLNEIGAGTGGSGLAKLFRLGTRHQCRNQVGEACCRRGGVAGAEPPHKGGPNRPDRPELQGLGARGQGSETAATSV